MAKYNDFLQNKLAENIIIEQNSKISSSYNAEMEKNSKNVEKNKNITKKNEELVQKVLEDFKERQFARRNMEALWKLNINFYMGNQYCSIMRGGEIENTYRDYMWQEQEVFNHIAPTIEERLSNLTRVRPMLAVEPATSDEDDVRSAEASTKILNSLYTKLSLGDKIYEATKWSEICGTAFYKVAWSPTLGQIVAVTDENGEIRSGEVEVSVCSPFEIYPDNLCASNLDEVQSLIHAKVLTCDEVKALYGVSLEGETINVFSLDTGATMSGGLGYNSSYAKVNNLEKKDAVIVLERYDRPSVDHPNGRLIIIAGDVLVFEGDLPFANGEDGAYDFPFIRQVCFEEVSSFFGGSMVTRLVPVQRAYNAVKNRKHELMNRISGGVLSIEDGSVDIEELEDEGLKPGKVLIYRQGSTAPQFIEQSQALNDFDNEEDKLLDEFSKLSGVSSSSSIDSVNANMSATAIQLLLDENEMRLSVTLKIMQSAIKEVGRQILRLYKQFAIVPRLARIVGEDASVDIFYFSQNDISSDDVKIITESETGESASSRRELIFKLLEYKILTNSEGEVDNFVKEKVLDFVGLSAWKDKKDLSETHTRRAERENESLIKGEKVDVYAVDDHNLHIKLHTAKMLSREFEVYAKKNKGCLENFISHINAHKQMLGE